MHGSVGPKVQDDGCFAAFKWPSPDDYRVELYAHRQRHDVEKRRPAPLTR